MHAKYTYLKKKNLRSFMPHTIVYFRDGLLRFGFDFFFFFFTWLLSPLAQFKIGSVQLFLNRCVSNADLQHSKDNAQCGKRARHKISSNIRNHLRRFAIWSSLSFNIRSISTYICIYIWGLILWLPCRPIRPTTNKNGSSRK